MRRVMILAAGLAAAAPMLAAPAAWAADLHLSRVMLSSAGLGYFEWQAQVQGDDSVSLDVPASQVDDLLKSLVVFDDKGGVTQVELPAREASGRLFENLPFDRAGLESPPALLNELQGARIAVGGTATLAGRIVKVEPETVDLGDRRTTRRHRVTLLTDSGLAQFVLEDAQSIRFEDPALAAQLEDVLGNLSAAADRGSRHLQIGLRGAGPRTVRLAYVVEAPVWKAAYRLTLGADPAAVSAHMQGWAVLENMSGQDWKDVELTLVSGSPATFRQALYTSYYVDRPQVPVEVVGRILPQVDQGASVYEAAAAPRMKAMAPPAPAAMAAAPAEDAAPPPPAEVSEAPTQVAFKLPAPVSVPAGRSLSLPIIDRDVPAAALDLYGPDQSLNPLAAVELTNDAGTGLPPGIVTLYGQGAPGLSYVGDARVGAVPAGERRMLSYALDQRLRIDRRETRDSVVAAAKIEHGLLHVTSFDRRVTVIKAAPSGDAPTRLVIDVPKEEGFVLKEPPAGTQESQESWRVPVTVAPGAAVTTTVTAERPDQESLSLVDITDEQLALYAQGDALDAASKEVFDKLAGLRRTQAQAQADVDQAGERIDAAKAEQGRLRDNLAAVPKDSDLARRYLKKLDEQETEIERLYAGQAQARTALEAARKAIAGYLAGL